MLANQLRGSWAQQSAPKIWMPNDHITLDHLQINDSFRDFYYQFYTSEHQSDHDAAALKRSLSVLSL